MMEAQRQYGRADIEYSTWYSSWSKMLAKKYTRIQLQNKLGSVAIESEKASASHLKAIERTSSMHSQSQRRAQARNLVVASGEEKRALRGALEIYELFPEHTFESEYRGEE